MVVEKTKKTMTVERLVLVVSLVLNCVQVISDEAQEWVSMSRQSEPQKEFVEQVQRPDSLIAKQSSKK